MSLSDMADAGPRPGINTRRAIKILSDLCAAYDKGLVTGDSCNRLCYSRNWVINDFYEGHKVVVVLKDGGQLAVYKSSHPTYQDFETPDFDMSDDEFSDKVLDLINDRLGLGWPREYKKHLMETLWPTLLRTPGETLSEADKTSLWTLLQQPEFIIFRVLPLTRVTPKLIGTCGNFYQTESLVAFRMKKYYMNLKGKILVHIMGTMKLLYEFLNDPLQWCDVRFDNLGLSADYPKRFVLMDADDVYTESKLNSLLKGRPCASDADCAIGDCAGRCLDTMTCSSRTNSNLEVLCEKLVRKLYASTWSKNNRYLAACNDPSMNVTQRLADLRLAWSWNLPDV
ncbi:unnamed protein product [Auanema sp. JU1783]|nr:unnamed protein product [Auanema sp. JU1783]